MERLPKIDTLEEGGVYPGNIVPEQELAVPLTCDPGMSFVDGVCVQN